MFQETGCQANNFHTQTWQLFSKFITQLPSTKVYFAQLHDIQHDQRMAKYRIHGQLTMCWATKHFGHEIPHSFIISVQI